MIEATLLLPLISAAIVVSGIPLWISVVKPNRFYGLRTAVTLADEAIWYAANRATGRDLVLAGGASFLLSLLLPELGVSGAAYVAAMAAILAASVGLVTLVALARARLLRL